MFMNVDIISDTICPWCFVGKRRFERALAKRPDVQVEVRWRTFQLNPEMPLEGINRREYVNQKFGSEEQAHAVFNNIREAGRIEGISFDFSAIPLTPNTIDSHRLIRWAGSAGFQDAVVERLFERYFTQGADIGCQEELIDVAQHVGMDADLVSNLFKCGEDIELVRKEDDDARAMGVTAVPCFVFAKKYVVFGAQDSDAFNELFDHMAREAESESRELETANSGV
jgi:predicted DsbA family dithiol-disulfide isomerase